ncbi:MAG: ABC transporter permease [Anaerolineales bacterium]|nr:ABC transporter permease [Anaerolineales bacterium]
MSTSTAPSLRSHLAVTLASAKMRLITITRYPGQLFTDIIIPIVFAAMPILLGRASGGADAAEVFKQNTGTDNYVGYMLIGASVFGMVSFAFWHVAYWLRWEMETGTLEALYLTPTGRIWIAGGTALYSMIRSIFSALIAYFLGSWILGSNPFQGELLIAFVFIMVGMIPLYGMTLLFGAVILKLKEANALINLMQWGVNFLMGVFFPITILPPFIRFIALLFPPTWMTNGVRSALLGIGFFFGKWYLDLAVLWAFLLVAPLVGYWVFMKVENGVRRNEGVGQF